MKKEKQAKRKRPGRKLRARSTAFRTFLLRLSDKMNPDFRPDSERAVILKGMIPTRQQLLMLLRWGLYAAVCLLMLVLQDTVMSRFHFMHATTDLVPAVVLLLTVLEGTDTGCIFVLIASVVYHFSGTAPGAYCVGFLMVFGILAALLRQFYWHRSPGAIILCSAVAVMAYEAAIFGTALFQGLTYWGRIWVFVLTGLFSSLAQIPLYFLLHKIGTIGGYIWKE